LEGELERDEPADLVDIFTDDPEGFWSAIVRRKGGQYELVARMPLDPSLNENRDAGV
jgi:putative transcriptional regulator